MTAEVASSEFVLPFLMGVSTFIGLLHLGVWRRGNGPASHGWVALFCAVSIVFMAGNRLATSTLDMPVAVRGARIQVAAGAFLVFSLLGFARSLRRRAQARLFHAGLLLVTCALALAGLVTDFMILDTGVIEPDWFGREHASADGAPGTVWVGLYAVLACLYVVMTVNRAPELSRWEKRVLNGSVAVYAAMGGWTVASTLGLIRFPILTQFGLVVIAGALSHLLVSEHRRMQVDLQRMVGERARQLHETDERYRLLVENAPLGIFALDREGRALALNRYLLQMLGLPRAEGIEESGTARLDVLGSESVVRSGLARKLRACIDDGHAFAGDFVFGSQPGSSREWRINAVPIRDASQGILGVQAIAEEIGDRKRLEERLRQSQKMEAVGGLAAGIAHELNNPLSYVRANLAMLREEWRELSGSQHERPAGMDTGLAACREMIDDALEGVDRAVTIVREVNEFSSGQDRLRSDADLNELLEDSVRLATPQLRPGMSVERRYGTLPLLACAPGQIRQVFLNLIVNAIHALDEGGRIVLETRHDPETEEVVVRVLDDGAGIAEEDLDRLFEPFFTTKPAGQGTGLGLYICYQIVHMHEGTISVATGARSGTCVEVHLPCKT